MINIRLVCVGNIKENFFTKAIEEYSKRLNAFCKFEIIELKEYKLLKENQQEIAMAKAYEGKQIENALKGYCIALEINGKCFTSEQFAKEIEKISISGNSTITFVIGGSHGIDKRVSDMCSQKLSFSSFTFPHQLMRVIFVEQIYRAFTILAGKNYHK